MKKSDRRKILLGIIIYNIGARKEKTTQPNQSPIIEYNKKEIKATNFIILEKEKNTDISFITTERIKMLQNEIENLKKENEQLIRENNYYKSIIPNDREWECLYRVATAEAGYQDAQAQKNVIYVILNRISSELFPNTIEEVVFAPGQFACIANKAYNNVEITDFTILNVKEAFWNYEKDVSAMGALFFTTKYFNNYEYLFTDSVGHKFFK